MNSVLDKEQLQLRHFSRVVNELRELADTETDEQARAELCFGIVILQRASLIVEKDYEAKVAKQRHEERMATSAMIREHHRDVAELRANCQHEGGIPKHTVVVFVADDNGGYILCQACRAVIRPESQLQFFPPQFQLTRSDVIFNTKLFDLLSEKTWYPRTGPPSPDKQVAVPINPIEEAAYYLPLADLRKLADAQ
jgi:hypothetical protein